MSKTNLPELYLFQKISDPITQETRYKPLSKGLIMRPTANGEFLPYHVEQFRLVHSLNGSALPAATKVKSDTHTAKLSTNAITTKCKPTSVAAALAACLKAFMLCLALLNTTTMLTACDSSPKDPYKKFRQTKTLPFEDFTDPEFYSVDRIQFPNEDLRPEYDGLYSIYSVKVDGSDPRMVVPTEWVAGEGMEIEPAHKPVRSPNRRYVVLTVNAKEWEDRKKQQRVVVDLHTKEVIPMIDNVSTVPSYAFTADSNRVQFFSNWDLWEFDIPSRTLTLLQPKPEEIGMAFHFYGPEDNKVVIDTKGIRDFNAQGELIRNFEFPEEMGGQFLPWVSISENADFLIFHYGHFHLAERTENGFELYDYWDLMGRDQPQIEFSTVTNNGLIHSTFKGKWLIDKTGLLDWKLFDPTLHPGVHFFYLEARKDAADEQN